MRRFRALEELGVARLVHAAAAVQVGDDDAGIDGIDADADRREIQRRDARELIDGGLAHAVRRDAGERPRAGDTRDVDDRALRRA